MVPSLKYFSPTGWHNTTVICLPEWASTSSRTSHCSKGGRQHSKGGWFITVVQNLKMAWVVRLYLKITSNEHIMGSSLCYHGDSSLHTLSQDGMTPLIVTSYKGHSRVVRVLLQAGAIPNATSQVRYSSCQMLPQGSFVCWKYMCTQLHSFQRLVHKYWNVTCTHSYHLTHEHMTVRSVWRVCPSCCSRKWTQGHCWATAGGKCWS